MYSSCSGCTPVVLVLEVLVKSMLLTGVLEKSIVVTTSQSQQQTTDLIVTCVYQPSSLLVEDTAS